MLNLTNNSGVYILELFAEEDFQLLHNKFQSTNFKKGYYFYFGSAQKNLSQRIFSHLKKEKNKYWHIDYLTTKKNISVERVFIIKGLLKNYECILVNELERKFELNTTVTNFGNSDCGVCKSHLLHSEKKINYNHLCSLYQSTVLFIPSSKDIC